jgi:hypothetical protein
MERTAPTENALAEASLPEIAAVIAEDSAAWNGGRVNPAAQPYLDAMFSINSVEDSYGLDSGKGIVARFLSNASTWRGEIARSVKAELNRRVS